MTICREGLNKMRHKTRSKLQKLLQSKATASYAFPTMPNWAREAPETQEVRESKFELIDFPCSTPDTPGTHPVAQHRGSSNMKGCVNLPELYQTGPYSRCTTFQYCTYFTRNNPKLYHSLTTACFNLHSYPVYTTWKPLGSNEKT